MLVVLLLLCVGGGGGLNALLSRRLSYIHSLQFDLDDVADANLLFVVHLRTRNGESKAGVNQYFHTWENSGTNSHKLTQQTMAVSSPTVYSIAVKSKSVSTNPMWYCIIKY